MRLRMLKHKMGFTLVELLVVVIIIGILSAVALPQYQKAIYKSKFSKLKILVASIAEAQEAYYVANRQYATRFKELPIEMPAGWHEPSGKTGEDSQYLYDWGNCTIAISEDTSIKNRAWGVLCRDSSIGMTYRVWFQHLPSGLSGNNGLRHCQSLTADATTIQARICETETGSEGYVHSSPGSSSSYRVYVYQQ